MFKNTSILVKSLFALVLIGFFSPTKTFKNWHDWHKHHHTHEVSALYNNTKDTLYVTNTSKRNKKKVTLEQQIAPGETFELQSFFGNTKGRYTLSIYRNKTYKTTKTSHKRAHLIKTVNFEPTSHQRYTIQLEEGGMVNKYGLEAIIEHTDKAPKKIPKSVKEMKKA